MSSNEIDHAISGSAKVVPRSPDRRRRTRNLTIIGLGNEYLSDDGIGVYVVRQLKRIIGEETDGIGFVELAVGGLPLLDFIIGYERCIIVDAVVTGRQPVGTIYKCTQLSSHCFVKLTTSHQIDLSQTLGLAKLFDADIPHIITIYGIEAGDVTTFAQHCTDPVENAIPSLVELIRRDIETGPTAEDTSDEWKVLEFETAET